MFGWLLLIVTSPYTLLFSQNQYYMQNEACNVFNHHSLANSSVSYGEGSLGSIKYFVTSGFMCVLPSWIKPWPGVPTKIL